MLLIYFEIKYLYFFLLETNDLYSIAYNFKIDDFTNFITKLQ